MTAPEVKGGEQPKRGQPLRRIPLARGASVLRSMPLRAVSKKRQKANAHRTKVLAHVREFQDWCSRCGQTGVGLDAHELKSRAQGGSIIDLENIVLVCRPCHEWITASPREAAEQGWAISKKWSAT